MRHPDGAIHALHAQLLDLGVCREGSLEPFHPSVRDRDDVAALRCRDSGIVLLSRIDHIDTAYYPDKEHAELATLGDRERVARAHDEDTVRRVASWGGLITNRCWLDVGTGAGGILDAMHGRALSTQAVEPQGEFQALLRAHGHVVYASTAEVPADSIEIATLFHVFEHMPDPLGELRALRRCLVPGGRVVIEVPHARDFLLDFLELAAFRAFTLWSEHLLLHTRDSLRRMLAAAGFTDVTIRGVQRYPLANHLHWTARGRPGGHQVWSMLRDDDVDVAYGSLLARLDATDTLVCEAVSP